jgi:hypothetical protein
MGCNNKACIYNFGGQCTSKEVNEAKRECTGKSLTTNT